MASPSFFSPSIMFRSQPLHEQVEEEEEDDEDADDDDDEDHHNHNHRHSSFILNPFLSSSNSPLFPEGTAAAMAGKRPASFSGNAEAGEEDVSDDCSQQHGEKKRRLNAEQLRTLEKNFELGNKLEPERKMQLAISLRLQPRQVAIWFQNRRARWKTKQLEKDYDLLKLRFQSVEAENNALHAQNKKLEAQISALKQGREAAELINLNRETEGPCSNRSENSSEINLERSLNHSQGLQFLPSISPKLCSSSSASDLQCSRIKNAISEEQQFGHLLLYGMEDQTAFWPWPDHHHIHH